MKELKELQATYNQAKALDEKLTKVSQKYASVLEELHKEIALIGLESADIQESHENININQYELDNSVSDEDFNKMVELSMAINRMVDGIQYTTYKTGKALKDIDECSPVGLYLPEYLKG